MENYPQRDEFGALPPVRDWRGSVVWYVSLQSVNEKTCVDCGETVPEFESFCARCRGADCRSESLAGTNLILTTAYLHEDEYILLKK